MENDLDICIALYEQEKSQLESMIQECLVDVEGPDSDYLSAHYHQQALFKTNRILDKLYKIKDPLYPQKKSIQRQISIIETRIEELKKNGSNYKSHIKLRDSEEVKQKWLNQYLNILNQNLNDLIKKLEKLNIPPFENSLYIENSILIITLENLIDKRISQFKLILNRSINFYLHFFYKKNHVNIIIPNIKFMLKNHHIWKSQIEHFQKIGFIQVNSNRLLYSVKISNKTGLSEITLLLTKIIYEVFVDDQFRNEHFIEF